MAGENSLDVIKSKANAYFEKQKTKEKFKQVSMKYNAEFKKLKTLEVNAKLIGNEENSEDDDDDEDENQDPNIINDLQQDESSQTCTFDNDTMDERLKNIIEEYNKQQQELGENNNKFNEVESLFLPRKRIPKKRKPFTSNNMRNVLNEVEMIQRKGQEFRPRSNTEYDDQVFTHLIDFYGIDIKWFDIRKEFKKGQIKSNLTFRERRRVEMDRQMKKHKNYLKVPETLKKIQKGVKLIQMMNRFAGNHQLKSRHSQLPTTSYQADLAQTIQNEQKFIIQESTLMTNIQNFSKPNEDNLALISERQSQEISLQ